LIDMHASIRSAVVMLLFAAPVAGQGTGRQGVPPRTPPKTKIPAPMAAVPPVKQDTGKKGYALDFQDQDIRVVLSALAEAGNLNLSYSNLPSRKVTLRMGQSATPAEIAGMIKGIAAANDLKVTENGTLMQIVGPPTVAAPTPQQQQQQAAAAADLKLYTYRLKHASAASLAPVLTSLFSNTTGGVGGVGVANNNAATQFALPGAGTNGRGGGAAGGGAAGGGRGGGAGGAGFGGAAGNAAVIGGAGAAGNAQLQGLQGLQQLFGGGAVASNVRIVGEPTSNSLLVRATAADWVLIQQVLGAVDLRPLQVLIEVTIAEVARTHDLSLGISGTAGSHSGKPADSVSLPSAAGARDFILKLTGGGGAIDYNIALNALQTRGNTRVLSLPVIIAQNNVQAILNVGESRPFVQVNQSVTTGTVPTTVQTIQYIDVGTTLTITPTINNDGYVNLVVDQTDNSATTEVQFNAPVISKREATTQVFLKDGQTTVVGGLAGKSSSKTVSGIPILSKIPIIGGLLFGNTTETTTISELYLFLTPHIIAGDSDIDRLRNAVKGSTELLTGVPMDARFVPTSDTIKVRLDTLKMKPVDSVKKPVGRSGGGPA
jgi:type II secretory pathway component GspD/PulD (secretin)